jgi:hypothetical protein
MGPWYAYISIGAAVGLWVVIHGWNPADHPPPAVTPKSIMGVVLGAIGGAGGAYFAGGIIVDSLTARATVAALATGYVLSGIGTFLGTARGATRQGCGDDLPPDGPNFCGWGR